MERKTEKGEGVGVGRGKVEGRKRNGWTDGEEVSPSQRSLKEAPNVRDGKCNVDAAKNVTLIMVANIGITLKLTLG